MNSFHIIKSLSHSLLCFTRANNARARAKNARAKNAKVHLTTVFLTAGLLMSSCSLEQENYKPLGDGLAHPTAIAQDGSWFYVVNSDIERLHNAGSILTINQKGEKKGVIATPRLGRFILSRPPYLLVGHSATNQYKTQPQLRIYSTQNPTKLVLVKTFSLGCSPINGIAPKNYNYFAISCDNGDLYLGVFVKSTETKKVTDLRLKLVRNYGPHARRALYIDTKNHHLYAFPTDWQRSNFSDQVLEDSKTYSETYVKERPKKPVDFSGVVSRQATGELFHTNIPNEIPDPWELQGELQGKITLKERQELWSEYQFALLDIKKVAQDNFVYASSTSEQTLSELRWLYFKTPEDAQTVPKGSRYYRTNFWEVRPDSQNSSRFYISQRGVQDNRNNLDVNSLYQVEIIGSPFDQKDPAKIPPTSSYLKFSKVWANPAQKKIYPRQVNGYSASNKSYINGDIRFTGNFITTDLYQKTFFVINDFRDPALFDDNAYSLTLASSERSATRATKDLLLFTERSRSYFSIAAIKSMVLAGTFYAHALSIFSITPEGELRYIRDIR